MEGIKTVAIPIHYYNFKEKHFPVQGDYYWMDPLKSGGKQTLSTHPKPIRDNCCSLYSQISYFNSSSCRWWQTFLVKAFNPLCEEGEILQIWPTKFQQPYFSNHKVFLKPKLIEKFALSSENNLRESGKVLTYLICFLKTFFRLPFSR